MADTGLRTYMGAWHAVLSAVDVDKVIVRAAAVDGARFFVTLQSSEHRSLRGRRVGDAGTWQPARPDLHLPHRASVRRDQERRPLLLLVQQLRIRSR